MHIYTYHEQAGMNHNFFFRGVQEGGVGIFHAPIFTYLWSESVIMMSAIYTVSFEYFGCHGVSIST